MRAETNIDAEAPHASLSGIATALKYDKGDRRRKHVGTTMLPVIDIDPKKPHRYVGKCPKGLDQKAEQILKTSLASSLGDGAVTSAKHRYAVHEGAIYEAATSDGGSTYHGYPYRGKLPKKLIAALRLHAQTEGTESTFDKWVKEHIIEHGSWTP